jgi:hypothetical protein
MPATDSTGDDDMATGGLPDAIRLFYALPGEFFISLLLLFAPRHLNALTAIPLAGVICFVAGLAIAFKRSANGILLNLLPIVPSQILVAIAGYFLGRVSGGAATAIVAAFLVLQLVLIGYIIYRSRRPRLPWFLLGFASFCYALVAALTATMAFSDTWL